MPTKPQRAPTAETPRSRAWQAARSAYGRAGAALRQDVWDVELVSLSRARRSFVRLLRVAQLVYRGFKHDECMLHASSLTFITLLAIVPVLALALSMARVFGAGDMAREQLKSVAREWIAETPASALVLGTPAAPVQPSTAAAVPVSPAPAPAPPPREVVSQHTPESPAEAAITLERIEQLIDTGFERIEGLNFRALGGLGIVFLLWTVLTVLGQVEAAFNRVWGVTEQRPLLRKFTDYLSVLIVFPVLLIAATSIPAVDMVTRLMGSHGEAVVGRMLGFRLIRLLGIIGLLTLSFAFLLRFLPHTRVRPWPSLAGGLATAVLSLGWLRLCMAFQLGVAKNSVFFGSFATVPVLLSWVYVSWEILLFGAEVSFAVQNADTYRMEQGAAKASLRTRLMVAVDLLATAARQLRTGDGLLRIPVYVRERRISVRLVNDVVHELSERQLLAEVAGEAGAFAARRDVLNLTVADVVQTLLDTGAQPAAIGLKAQPSSPLCDPLDAALAKILPQRIADVNLDLPASHA
jgi:YihY family inner membrane protein